MSPSPTVPGRAVEAIRTTARRRFLAAATFFAIGTLSLFASQVFALAHLGDVGVLTALILGVLLQILGLIAGAYGATVFRGTHPLSEAADLSRRLLVVALAAVLPLAALLTAAWALVSLGPANLLLLPELPLFWGPVTAVAAAGLVYAARELASERMAILAGVGCGAVIAVALSAGGWSLLAGAASIQSGRLAVDLLLATVGFLVIALAFERDAWIARSPRGAAR